MNEFADRFEIDYTLDSMNDLNEIAGYHGETDTLSLYEVCDIWARRALAANGFGDY
jgi:hypothetical protein